MNRKAIPAFLFATLALSPLATAQEVPPAGGPPSAALSSNLTWVMAANFIIWGGIAGYVFWLHLRASKLERQGRGAQD